MIYSGSTSLRRDGVCPYLAEGDHRAAWDSLEPGHGRKGLVGCGRRKSGGRVRDVLERRPGVIDGE